jgi:predicted esterase
MAKDNALPILLGAAAAFLILGKGKGCTPECENVGPNGGMLAGIKYHEFRTKGVSQGEELPMVIAFHSFGTPPDVLLSTGRNRVSNTKGPVRVIVPASPRTIGNRGYLSWFGSMRAGSKDQEKLSAAMREAGEEMNEFICQITACLPTKGKPVVYGTSQGGSMAYMMASLYPGSVDAAAAMAGWIPKDMWNTGMAPTIAGHGNQDSVVSYSRTADYWSTMKDHGARIYFKDFNTAHNMKGGMGKYLNQSLNKILGYA